MRKEEAINALRLTNEELRLLLSRLDRDVLEDETSTNRLTRRWPLQLQHIVLTVCCSATESKHLIVVPRNISVEGMSILHGGFLHPESSCHVTLRQVTGKPKTIAARVTRCRHIEKHLHEIGLLFLEPVDPRAFSINADGDQLFNADHVSPDHLAGRVMIVAESNVQAGIKAGFRGTELELVFAFDAASALSLLQEDVDLVYVQETLPDTTGAAFLERLGAHSSAKSIMLLPEACDQSRDLARSAGAEEVLVWPCESAVLLRSAAEYLLLDDLVEMSQRSDPITRLKGSHQTTCTEKLVSLSEQLASTMNQGDSISALDLTQQIQELAATINDAVLAKRTTEALQVMTESGAMALDELGLVVRMCWKIAGYSPADAVTNEAA